MEQKDASMLPCPYKDDIERATKGLTRLATQLEERLPPKETREALQNWGKYQERIDQIHSALYANGLLKRLSRLEQWRYYLMGAWGILLAALIILANVLLREIGG